MKALEKDRTRRYDTANGFARDIQRYLADEVVEARPPSRGYRLEEIRQAEQDPGDRGEPGLLDAGRRDRGHELGDGRRPEGRRRRKPNSAALRTTSATRRSRPNGRPALERDKAIAAEARPRTINEFLTNDLLTQAEPANNAVEDKVTLAGSPRPRGREGGDAVRGPAGARTSPPQDDREHLSWPGVLGEGRSAVGGPCSTRRGSAIHGRPTPTQLKASSRTSFVTAVDGTPRSWRWPRRPLERRDCERHARPRPPRHPEPRSNNLALALRRHAGRLPEAIALLRARPRRQDRQARPRPSRHPEQCSTTSPWPTRTPVSSPRRSPCSRRVRDGQIAKLGPDHPNTLIALNNLGLGVPCSLASSPRRSPLLRTRPRRPDRQARPRPPRHPDHAP